MQLSNEAIQEFKQIYKEEYGEEISDDEANKLGVNFLNFCRIIFRPLPDNIINQKYDGEKQL